MKQFYADPAKVLHGNQAFVNLWPRIASRKKDTDKVNVKGVDVNWRVLQPSNCANDQQYHDAIQRFLAVEVIVISDDESTNDEPLAKKKLTD